MSLAASLNLSQTTSAENADNADAPVAPALPAAERLSEADLAELLTAFNTLTDRMQRSHEALTGEVARLKGELSRANEQLRRSERLAAIGHMAAGIAHEIRNPLASIQLYGEILEQDLAGNEQLQPLASKIRNAVHGLDAIVRDVLAFAREVTLRPSDLVLSDVLAGAVVDCQGALSAAGAQVHDPIVEPDDCIVVADASLLRVVFSNLIRNAAEAMAELPDDNERRLDIRAERQQSKERGEVVRIAFRDTGPGIPPEVRERMFNPFFTTRAAGTGLGLAIVYRILEAHGAEIEVAATLSEEAADNATAAAPPGAEITITLPTEGRQLQDAETHG